MSTRSIASRPFWYPYDPSLFTVNQGVYGKDLCSRPQFLQRWWAFLRKTLMIYVFVVECVSIPNCFYIFQFVTCFLFYPGSWTLNLSLMYPKKLRKKISLPNDDDEPVDIRKRPMWTEGEWLRVYLGTNNVGDNTRSPSSTMTKMRSKREATEQENESIRHRVLRRVGAASRRKTSKFAKQRLPNQQEAKRFQCLFRRPSNTYKYALFPNAVDSDLALYYLIMYVVFSVLSVLSLFDMYSPLVTSNSISTLFMQ